MTHAKRHIVVPLSDSEHDCGGHYRSRCIPYVYYTKCPAPHEQSCQHHLYKKPVSDCLMEIVKNLDSNCGKNNPNQVLVQINASLKRNYETYRMLAPLLYLQHTSDQVRWRRQRKHRTDSIWIMLGFLETLGTVESITSCANISVIIIPKATIIISVFIIFFKSVSLFILTLMEDLCWVFSPRFFLYTNIFSAVAVQLSVCLSTRCLTI